MPDQFTTDADFWRVYPPNTGYRVSREGQVECRLEWDRQTRTYVLGNSWRPIRARILPNGYHQIDIRLGRQNGRLIKSVTYVHRMVLESFVGPCPPGMQGRHVNENDPSNNRLENLAWGTRKQNAADKRQHGSHHQGSRCHRSKLTEADVIRIREMRRDGVSPAEIARAFGVARVTATRAALGDNWQHIGPSNAERTELRRLGWRRGEKHYNAKVTAAVRAELLALRTAGASVAGIMARLGLGKTTVLTVLRSTKTSQA